MKKIRIIDGPVIFEDFSHKPNNYIAKKLKFYLLEMTFYEKEEE